MTNWISLQDMCLQMINDENNDMKSPDYKNGYNDCCEDVINQICVVLNCHVDVNSSIGDSLRKLRQGILDKSFSRYEDDK